MAQEFCLRLELSIDYHGLTYKYGPTPRNTRLFCVILFINGPPNSGLGWIVFTVLKNELIVSFSRRIKNKTVSFLFKLYFVVSLTKVGRF